MKDAILEFPSRLDKPRTRGLIWYAARMWFLPRWIWRRARKRRAGWNAIVLGDLDDHLLADIGLHRDEIMRIEQDERPAHEPPV
jgi:uncharacterized protein YjiS (DUF1127 family)